MRARYRGTCPILRSQRPQPRGAPAPGRFTGTHERFAAKLKYQDIELLINVDGKKDYTFTFED
ncbi:MAG TPA: hypothetical protein VEL76_15110 [Gemmataceae bacterium]|nr:hypothetical protein [Gemmataceae bacterium]